MSKKIAKIVSDAKFLQVANTTIAVEENTDVVILSEELELFDTSISILDELENNAKWIKWLGDAKNGIYNVSFSFLRSFSNSPFESLLYRTQKKESDALKFGTLVHKVVLEYDDFLKNYIILPRETNMNSGVPTDGKIGTKEYAKYVAYAIQKGIKPENIVKLPDFKNAKLLREMFWSNNEIKTLINRIQKTEVEYKFSYWYNGNCFDIHCFIDAVLDNNCVFDIKNMQNLHNYENTIFYDKYLMQAVIYLLCVFLAEPNSYNEKENLERYKYAIERIPFQGEFYFIAANVKEGVVPPIKLSPEKLQLGINLLHETLDNLVTSVEWHERDKNVFRECRMPKKYVYGDAYVLY